MIRVGNVEELLNRKIFDKKSAILLGAGATGQNTCELLVDQGISVRCLVDEAPERRDKKYFNTPVMREMPPGWRDECVPILCIGPMAVQPDHVIAESDFMKRMGIPEDVLIVLDRPKGIWEKMHYLFEENGIDRCGDFLNIKSVVLPNYLKMEPYVRRAFLLEAGDLILPQFFDEWSEIDEGPYEGTDVLLQETGGIVFDCGANIGIFTAIAASNMTNLVYAFEPMPSCGKCLEDVSGLYSNVEIVPRAVMDVEGSVVMTNPKCLEQSRTVEFGEDVSNGIDVASTTLDAFVEERGISRVDFIKADIEGAERQMLRGAKRILREFAPRLSICTYHFSDDPEILEAIIKAANPSYRVIQKKKKLYAYVE